jgi:hypothetical protein
MPSKEAIHVIGSAPGAALDAAKGMIILDPECKPIRFDSPMFCRAALEICSLSEGVPSAPRVAPSLWIACLTISGSPVSLRRLDLTCTIQVTGKARIHAVDCKFSTFERAECSVEIIGGSEGYFENCVFESSALTAVLVRHDSRVACRSCDFQYSAASSVVARAKSTADICDCQFHGAAKFSVYFHENSSGVVSGCRFFGQAGKGILLLKGSGCKVSDCVFDGCAGGGVSVSDKSAIFLRRSTFRAIPRLAFHVSKEATAMVEQCAFEASDGNGIFFESSHGFARNCSFRGLKSASIVVIGEGANPVITDCLVSEAAGNAVVARDSCSPVFERLIVYHVAEAAFALSDFARPVLVGCVVTETRGPAFSVCNGADAKVFQGVVDVTTALCAPVFSVLAFGKLRFAQVLFSGEMESVPFRVEHNGDFAWDSQTNGCLASGGALYGLFAEPGRLVRREPFGEMPPASPDYATDKWNLRMPRPISPPPPSARTLTIVPSPDALSPQSPHFPSGSVPQPAGVPPRPAAAPPPASASLSRSCCAFSFPDVEPPDRLPQISLPRNETSNHVASEFPPAPDPGQGAWFCLRCKRAAVESEVEPRVCVPCGHLVLCNACAEDVKRDIAAGTTCACPLCATVISTTAKIFLEPDGQCFAACGPADTVFLPCGHLCACYGCAMKLCAETHLCPQCRTRFTAFRRQFPLFSPP